LELSLPGAKVPGNESSRERKFQELLLPGAKVLRSESSCYRGKRQNGKRRNGKSRLVVASGCIPCVLRIQEYSTLKCMVFTKRLTAIDTCLLFTNNLAIEYVFKKVDSGYVFGCQLKQCQSRWLWLVLLQRLIDKSNRTINRN